MKPASQSYERPYVARQAGVELRDGGIDDVRKVIAGLSDADRRYILARGRTEYRDVPGRLAGRTVAYEGGEPVGFSDIYGVDNKGRVRPSPSMVVAVLDKVRGRRLAGTLAGDAMKKVLARAEVLRAVRGKREDRLRRFVWRLHEGNESSARAAAHAGFTEQEFARPYKYRQFVMSRQDAEKRASGPGDEKLREARAFVEAVRKMALRRKLNYFLVTDGASGISNNGNPAVRNAREAQIKWELEHGEDPYEDWLAESAAEKKAAAPQTLTPPPTSYRPPAGVAAPKAPQPVQASVPPMGTQVRGYGGSTTPAGTFEAYRAAHGGEPPPQARPRGIPDAAAARTERKAQSAAAYATGGLNYLASNPEFQRRVGNGDLDAGRASVAEATHDLRHVPAVNETPRSGAAMAYTRGGDRSYVAMPAGTVAHRGTYRGTGEWRDGMLSHELSHPFANKVPGYVDKIRRIQQEEGIQGTDQYHRTPKEQAAEFNALRIMKGAWPGGGAGPGGAYTPEQADSILDNGNPYFRGLPTNYKMRLLNEARNRQGAGAPAYGMAQRGVVKYAAVEKQAKALNTLKRLFGKDIVGKWRQMAAERDPGILKLLDKVIVKPETQYRPGVEAVLDHLRRGGKSRDFGTNGLRMSARHLDAIDPTGWLKREYAKVAGKWGARSPYGLEGHQNELFTSFWSRLFGKEDAIDLFHRDRALVPTVGENPAKITISHSSPWGASGYVDDRLELAYMLRRGRMADKRFLRELTGDTALRAANEIARHKRTVDAFTGGIAGPAINKSLVPLGEVLRKDMRGPGIVARTGKIKIIAPPDDRGRLVERGFDDHFFNSDGRKVFTHLTVTNNRRGPKRMFYDPDVLKHELGHANTWYSPGVRARSLLGGVFGRIFPRLKRRALMNRNFRAASWLDKAIGDEYAANLAAFGRKEAWPEQVQAAIDTYMLRSLRDGDTSVSPRLYRAFIRNYMPYGVSTS